VGAAHFRRPDCRAHPLAYFFRRLFHSNSTTPAATETLLVFANSVGQPRHNNCRSFAVALRKEINSRLFPVTDPDFTSIEEEETRDADR
jgi:hypothetical protein